MKEFNEACKKKKLRLSDRIALNYVVIVGWFCRVLVKKEKYIYRKVQPTGKTSTLFLYYFQRKKSKRSYRLSL